MCGIAGFIEKNNSSFSNKQPIAKINLMLDTIVHRGPDDYGIFHIGNKGEANTDNYEFQIHDETHTVMLGHRRLSIIDLSRNGHQPKHSTNKEVTIIFNGEIYNYIELREELKPKYTFYSGSDTEVLINAYIEWGNSMFNKLDGMFAFAIWNHRKQTLLCARDPFGIKPFYYALSDDAFVFASEPRTILKGLGISGSMNVAQIAEFLTLGISDHNGETSYNEIKQLKGGEWMEVDKNLKIINRQTYWVAPSEPKGKAFNQQEFSSQLQEAVKRQLRSDVQIGSSLSGGIDSGTLVQIAGELLGKEESAKYKTITFTSDNFKNDESSNAKLISESAGMTDWNPVKLDETQLENHLIKLISDIGEPFSSLSILAQNLVMKRAQELKVKVMLDGQGGDEVYLGYPRMALRIVGEYFKKGQWSKAFQEMKGLKTNASLSYFTILASNFFFSNAQIATSRNKARIEHLVNKDLLDKCRTSVAKDKYSNKSLQDLQVDELKKYILPRLLKYADRNSMAYSVESRVPHLSVPLVEYSLKQRYDSRVEKGWTKLAIRKVMNGRLPHEILWAKEKRGFDIPQARWTKELKPLLVKWIKEFEAANKIVNVNRLIQLIEEDKAGDMYVWRIISVLLWLKFLDVKF